MEERIVRLKFGTLGTRGTFRKGGGVVSWGSIVSTSIETSDQQPTN